MNWGLSGFAWIGTFWCNLVLLVFDVKPSSGSTAQGWSAAVMDGRAGGWMDGSSLSSFVMQQGYTRSLLRSQPAADDVLWKQQGVTSVANGSCPLFQNLHSPRDCGTADRAGSRPTWTLPGCGGVFSVRCWWRPPWPRRRMTTTPSRPAFSQVSHSHFSSHGFLLLLSKVQIWWTWHIGKC